ncbi:MAG: hypothetical protein E7603_01120 [Ruminococcaceae bacterium]|nr:hypothetical protein [Oscillospiraceae bacterium]
MEDYILLMVASAIAILIGLWNLIIAILGCFPKHRAEALGTLAKTNTLKNVPLKHGGYIPNLTKYTYVYTVNGKQYKYSAEKRTHKRNLFFKVTMVYVKGFPKHAYPNKFTGFKEWTLGIFLILMGSMFLFICINA